MCLTYNDFDSVMMACAGSLQEFMAGSPTWSVKPKPGEVLSMCGSDSNGLGASIVLFDWSDEVTKKAYVDAYPAEAKFVSAGSIIAHASLWFDKPSSEVAAVHLHNDKKHSAWHTHPQNGDVINNGSFTGSTVGQMIDCVSLRHLSEQERMQKWQTCITTCPKCGSPM